MANKSLHRTSYPAARWMLILLAGVTLCLTYSSDLWAHPPRFHVLAAVAQEQKLDWATEDPKGNYVYDKPDALVPARVLEEPLWYDATLAADEDSIWYAWLEFAPGVGDQLWIGRRQDGTWLWREPVLEARGDFAKPRLTITADQRVWLSYEAAPKDGPWDIWLVEIEKGQQDRKPLRISPATGQDINHRVCADPTGGMWITWQADNGGQFDVMARHVAEEKLGDVITLSKGVHGDWHPAVACEKDGTAHVVWDAYDGETYDVLWSKIEDSAAGTPVKVAASPGTECRAQVAIDPQDRVWIAWEEGGPNWGAPYRPKLSTTAMNDQLGPLHRFRYMRLAEGLPDGTVRKIEVPMPSHELAPKRSGLSPGATAVGAFYERGRLAVDGRGRLWIAYRHYYTPWLGVEHRNHVQSGWGVYARCLTDEGWSDLYQFAGLQGDGMQSLELAGQADGIAAVWTTGRTQRDDSKLPRGIVIGSIGNMQGKPVSKQAAVETDAEAQAVVSSAVPAKLISKKPDQQQERPKVELAGKSCELFFGDLHRHTDLSLCRVPVDGTIDDTYRYAIDAAALDFLGITDHSRDIAQGDHLSQLWWRSRKEVERHRLGSSFIPFYSYERSHSPTADHNIISLRDDMLRPHTYSVFKFMQELNPATTIAIPHQPVRRDTWLMQDDERRPLVEIFQGCRDNIIEEDVHQGLKKGYKLGIIASSDHMSTSASYACVWAEEPTRESIFQAMRDRRTYGATSKIQLHVKAGDHWMGEITSGPTLPPVEVYAEAEAPIRSVNFIIDGAIQKTVSPNKASIQLSEEVEMAGAHYVYVHLQLADGNHAWSSPIWVTPKSAR